jgi:hypothetical protein
VNTRAWTQRPFGFDERAARTQIHDANAAPGAKRCLHIQRREPDARIPTTIGYRLIHA